MLNQPSSRISAFRDSVSFSRDVRELVEVLNQDMEAPDRLQLRVESHPGGFVRGLSARRLAMAEAYVKLSTSNGPGNHRLRLSALRHLAHFARHSKTLSMPMNTARVQIALMKECVRSRNNKVRQLELMHDFTGASYGQEGVIRRLLRELGLMEVPEDGRPLKEMDLGWDQHVHDSSSLGRKDPSHLLLDAFIKGISRITVAFYDLTDSRVCEEVYEAARILGVGVEVGIEFSVGKAYERCHFMYIPPQDGTSEGLNRFLLENSRVLGPFLDGLKANAAGRQRTLTELLDNFNRVQLPALNERFSGIPQLQIPPVSWEDVLRAVPGGRVSRIQVGYVLAEAMRPALHRRVLYLRNQLEHALHRQREGGVSSWETDHIRKEYEEAVSGYRECSPHSLQQTTVTRGARTDNDSAFLDLSVPGGVAKRCGGKLVFIHPLSVGFDRAVECLLSWHTLVTDVEIFNMSDTLLRDPADLRRLNRTVGLLNSGDSTELLRQLGEWGVREIDPAVVERACAHYKSNPLLPACGSDYIGGHPDVPGMGFVSSLSVTRRVLASLRKAGHPTLPESIARSLLGQGDPSSVPADAQVFFVSKNRPAGADRPPGEGGESELGPRRVWRYLNPNLRLVTKIAIGLIPAWFVVGPWYALLWLGITALRNVLADVLSSSGGLVRAWSLSNVDRDNLGNSLFWTGFSVPVLGAAKAGFDVAWAALKIPADTFLHALAKFWTIAFANGVYISTHNRLRGFPATVVRANFFRTVLSWPLATVGSYGFNVLAVPAIVQSKIWSDVVAGVIEGTGKYLRRVKLRQRDFLELLRALKKASPETASIVLLDILYIWAYRDCGRSALKEMLDGRSPSGKPESGLPGLTSEDQELLKEARAMLARSFSSEGSIERLTCAVLEHFQGEEAEFLARTIGERHDEFVAWLGARHKI